MSGFFLNDPGALWTGAALAAVLALYLLHRRRRPLGATGLFLWGAPRPGGIGGRKRYHPPPRRSLAFDLLAAALFALALAGPSRRLATGLPALVILDNSFAMRARDAHVEARELVREILAAAGENGVEAGLMLAGERPTALRGPGRYSQGEWAALLADYLPDAKSSDLREAVVFARRLYGPALETHIVTNRGGGSAAGAAGRTTTHILPGRGGNLAFVRAWRAAGAADRERLYLAVANHGGPVEAVLTIGSAATPDRVLYRETVRLDGGSVAPLEISLAAAESVLTARLTAAAGHDVIADDSLIHIPPAPSRVATYRIDGVNPRAERYLRLGLEAAGCRPAPPDAAPDILATHGADAAGRVMTLVLTTPGELGVLEPPYMIDSASFLCRDLDLGGIPWTMAGRETPDQVAEIYIAAGDKPLYWRSGPGRLHLNLAPERCLIVNDPAWPVLLANLAAAARDDLPGLGKTLYHPGEALHCRPAAGEVWEALIFSSDRGEIPAAAGSEPPVPTNPGLYRLKSGEREIGEIAVLPAFGAAADASALADARGSIVAGYGAREEGRGVLDLAWLALALGLFLLGWNWRLESAGGSET